MMRAFKMQCVPKLEGTEGCCWLLSAALQSACVLVGEYVCCFCLQPSFDRFLCVVKYTQRVGSVCSPELLAQSEDAVN